MGTIAPLEITPRIAVFRIKAMLAKQHLYDFTHAEVICLEAAKSHLAAYAELLDQGYLHDRPKKP
jgi:hypothetical protein